MEFNVIDENNTFKIGNIISIFKLPNYNEEFALFSLSDFEEDKSSIQVAYLIKAPDGYEYIDEIRDTKVLEEAKKAAYEMLSIINQ